MKKFFSKLVLFALILTFSAGISSIAFAYDEADISSVTEQYLSSWNTTDFTQYLTDETATQEAVEQFSNWQSVKESLGEFSAIDGTAVTEAEGVITAVTTATYANSKLTFTMTFDSATVEQAGAMYAILSIDVSTGSDSAAPNLGRAILNTIMGMGIVFIVLILISYVIKGLGYVPNIIGSITGANKKVPEVSQKADNIIPTIVEQEENPEDDVELVAVITAAITAYESNQVSADGLVVRSIRRRQ